jgi:tetratricopeptide (TPR) repeat protein
MSSAKVSRRLSSFFAALAITQMPLLATRADTTTDVHSGVTQKTDAASSLALPVKLADQKVVITYVEKESKASEHLVEYRASGEYVINVIKNNGNDSEQIGRGLRLVALAMAQDKGVQEKKNGDYDAAQRDFAFAVQEARELRSDNILSETLRSYGSVCRLLKEYEKSMTAYKEALAILEKSEGLQSISAASTLDDTARVYDELNVPKEAEKLHKQALAVFEKLQGPTGPDVVICLYNLSDCYLHTDRFDDSIGALTRALSILEKRGEAESLDYATTVDNLGGVYSDAQKYDDAEKSHRKALGLFLKNAGPDSIDTAICYQNLANVLIQERKWLDAKDNYEKALKIESQIRGEDHPRVKALKAKVASLASRAATESK